MKNKKHENQFFSRLNVYLKKLPFLSLFKYLYYYFDKIVCIFLKKPKRSNGKKKVLILANLGMGDAINFLSVSDRLRKIYPSNIYKISIYVPKSLVGLIKQECLFDEVLGIDFNNIVTSIKHRISMIKLIRSSYYDCVIDIMGLPGCTPSMYLTACSLSNEKITIINTAFSTCPKFFYNRIFSKIFFINDKNISNIEYYNIFLDKLSGKKEEIKFHHIKNIKIKIDLPKEYFIVFPGASSDFKKWGIDNYSRLVDDVYKKTGLPLVLCGSSFDTADNNALINSINSPYIDLTNKTSILEFIQIVKGAKFIITNDTGAYHIAINENVPCTLIASNSYIKYISYDFESFSMRKPYIVNSFNYKCSNCHDNCHLIKKSDNIFPCLKDVKYIDVLKTVKKMIDELR